MAGNIKKIRLFFINFLFFSTNGFSQPANSVNLSLFGNGSIFSGSYERIVDRNENGLIAINAGVGYQEEFRICWLGPCSSPPAGYLTVFEQITYSSGKYKNFLDMGLGFTQYPLLNDNPKLIFYPLIGYRRQPQESRFNFRIYACLPLPELPDKLIVLPFNLSTGFCF